MAGDNKTRWNWAMTLRFWGPRVLLALGVGSAAVSLIYSGAILGAVLLGTIAAVGITLSASLTRDYRPVKMTGEGNTNHKQKKSSIRSILIGIVTAAAFAATFLTPFSVPIRIILGSTLLACAGYAEYLTRGALNDKAPDPLNQPSSRTILLSTLFGALLGTFLCAAFLAEIITSSGALLPSTGYLLGGAILGLLGGRFFHRQNNELPAANVLFGVGIICAVATLGVLGYCLATGVVISGILQIATYTGLGLTALATATYGIGQIQEPFELHMTGDYSADVPSNESLYTSPVMRVVSQEDVEITTSNPLTTPPPPRSKLFQNWFQ